MDLNDKPGSTWDRDFDLKDPTPEDARARATEKLERILGDSVQIKPAGLFFGRIVGGIFCLLFSVGLLYGAYVIWMGAEERYQEVLAAFVGLPGALLLIPAYRLIAGSKADTPFRALNLFYRCLARGNHMGATRLVARNDFDHFPRDFPRVPKVMGFPGSDWLYFEEPLDFQAYWHSLLRWPKSPYCIARVKKLKVTELRPGVIHCTYRLHLMINSSLWGLLIFVPYLGILVAIIVDLATRTTVKADLSKVLVQVEDEWHLLNGAWYEDDDRDPSWV